MKNNKNNKLLCTFTNNNELDITIKRINGIYIVKNNKILIIQNEKNDDDLYCIYNVSGQLTNGKLENTILIHRKKEYNILYTINSLNSLIKLLNKGVADSNFRVPWSSFENTILLLHNNEVNIIPTKLKEIRRIKVEY